MYQAMSHILNMRSSMSKTSKLYICGIIGTLVPFLPESENCINSGRSDEKVVPYTSGILLAE
jgi:hypothetical protein